MPHDPNRIFVVNTISRSQIAEDLNDYFWGHDHPPEGETGPLTSDDDRLTDAVCQEYAGALGDVEEDDEEGVANLQYETLQKIGLPVNLDA